MKLIAVSLAAFFLCAQDASFRADIQLINVAFTARQGSVAVDLAKDEIEILEDGAPQKIEFFAKSADLPLTLGLIVDASGSQEKFFKRHRRDIRTFLRTVVTPRDRAFLVGFGNHVRLVQDLTADGDLLVDNLERYEDKPSEFPRLGPAIARELGTAFYDSLYHSIEQRLRPVDRGRRALIMFSDGEDNSSAHHLLDVIEAAQSTDTVIFAVHYAEKRDRPIARNLYGKSVMARLASDTGGAYLEATDDLKTAFKQIGDQLRASYELAYRSPNTERDGLFRKIQIRAKGRPDVKVRHRTGYYLR